MAQFSAYERPRNHKNDRTIAVRNIIRDADSQRLRWIGGYNGVNSALGCSGSTFWRRWFLYGPSLPLLWWGPQPDSGDSYFGHFVQRLIGVQRYLRNYRLVIAELLSAEYRKGRRTGGLSIGRVEERRGSLGHSATLRFLSPLIEPDRQISRIRLSDKTSRLCFRVQRLLQFLNTHRSL